MDDNTCPSTLVTFCKFILLVGTAVYVHFRLTSSYFKLMLMSIINLIVYALFLGPDL